MIDKKDQSIEKPLLEVKNVHKKYGKKEVVKGINLGVKQGQIIGLLGPNGAGKTTSFYTIVGIEKPTQGQIVFDNIVINDLPMYKRALLGINYLPQESSIFRKLTVEENILAILELQNLNPVEKKESLEELLEFLKVAHIRKSLGYNLSGGEKRRVEIARALATKPRILLLDEPFSGIDPVTIFEIQTIISHLSFKLNVGIIITDHNVRETLRITDYAYIIVDGKIFYEGPPKKLSESKEVKEVYLGENFKL